MNATNQSPVMNAEPKKRTNGVLPNSRPQTIAPEQLRAARSLLDWTRSDLAQKSGMSAETIKNIEHGTFLPKKETIMAIVETFASRGVQFVHYETLVSNSAGSEAIGHLQLLSYAGVVRVTASVPEIKGEGHE